LYRYNQIIYDILGIPSKDMDYLTGCNAVRTNGSATATQAANASDNLNDYMGNLVSHYAV
jgi:fungal nitric oxide reductase